MGKRLLLLGLLPFLFSGSVPAAAPPETEELSLDGRLAIPPMPPAEPLPIATLASLLPRAQPLAPRFDWPESSDFEGAWEVVPQQSWGLGRGRLIQKLVKEGELAAFEKLSLSQTVARLESEENPSAEVVTRYRQVGEKLELSPVHTFGDRYGGNWYFSGTPLEPLGAVWHSDSLVVAWLPAEEEPPGKAREAEQATWAYARTLLGFEGDPYPAAVKGVPRDPAGEAAWKQWEAATDRDQKRTAAIALLDSKLPSSDERFSWVQAWAEQNGEAEVELAVMRRYRPMGRCSMDLRPAILASRYGELCFQTGKLGCTLHLQLRVMASNFDRFVWSSYGDEAAGTDTAALWELGIEARRFLMAFVLDYPDNSLPTRVGMYRLGRGMAESPEVDRLSGHLRAWAEDPALDGTNRLNAALALLNVRARYYGSYTMPAQELAELQLHPMARAVIGDIAATEGK